MVGKYGINCFMCFHLCKLHDSPPKCLKGYASGPCSEYCYLKDNPYDVDLRKKIVVCEDLIVKYRRDNPEHPRIASLEKKIGEMIVFLERHSVVAEWRLNYYV